MPKVVWLFYEVWNSLTFRQNSRYVTETKQNLVLQWYIHTHGFHKLYLFIIFKVVSRLCVLLYMTNYWNTSTWVHQKRVYQIYRIVKEKKHKNRSTQLNSTRLYQNSMQKKPVWKFLQRWFDMWIAFVLVVSEFI